MVQYQRFYQGQGKRRPKLVSFFFLSLFMVLSPLLFISPPTWIYHYSFCAQDEAFVADMDANVNASLCSSVPNSTICCDRSHFRFDTCIMKGDVRTHSASSSIFLYTSENSDESSTDKESRYRETQHEKIKPYTRKWETSIMDTIEELDLIVKKENLGTNHHCDVNHDVPAVLFSTGGYTGNLYHEFNDGILPLYITSQHLNKKVVFLILDYRNWWISKYGDVLSQLSEYPAVDFTGDNRTHCFLEVIVGLKIHNELTVDSSPVSRNASIVDFRELLNNAYWPRIKDLTLDEERDEQEKVSGYFVSQEPSESDISSVLSVSYSHPKRPNLVILSRNGTRAITNERSLVEIAEKVGFRVRVLRPDKTTELALVYRVLNSSDVMVGVHGAAMTHFLFLRPRSVFIQVIPLGTDWAAETYYGEPARRLGLRYIGYKIIPEESSLYEKYGINDPVLKNPRSVVKRGWRFTKEIYLKGQNVRLNLQRFQKKLVQAYDYTKINQ